MILPGSYKWKVGRVKLLLSPRVRKLWIINLSNKTGFGSLTVVGFLIKIWHLTGEMYNLPFKKKRRLASITDEFPASEKLSKTIFLHAYGRSVSKVKFGNIDIWLIGFVTGLISDLLINPRLLLGT